MLFDTHAHVNDPAFDTDRTQLLESLPNQGIGYMMNVGCCLSSSRDCVALARQYPYIYASVGTHPDSAAEVNDAVLDEYRKLCKENPKVKAIGEIGLDYHYDFSPRDAQKKVLDEQLSVDITSSDGNYVKFIPNATGVYTFTSDTFNDPVGTLYTYTEELQSDDDSGENNNFKIDYKPYQYEVTFVYKDADGKTGTFTMKYAGTNTPLTDHARMAYTSTRNYSIQDNVLGILSYAGKDGGRDTTLKAEGFKESDHSTVNWSHGTNTYQLFYYTFEFKD